MGYTFSTQDLLKTISTIVAWTILSIVKGLDKKKGTGACNKLTDLDT